MTQLSISASDVDHSAAGNSFFVTNAEPVAFKQFVAWLWDAYEGSPKSKTKVIPLAVAKPIIWIGEKVAGKKAPLSLKELGDSASKRWFSNENANRVFGVTKRIVSSLHFSASCRQSFMICYMMEPGEIF